MYPIERKEWLYDALQNSIFNFSNDLSQKIYENLNKMQYSDWEGDSAKGNTFWDYNVVKSNI